MLKYGVITEMIFCMSKISLRKQYERIYHGIRMNWKIGSFVIVSCTFLRQLFVWFSSLKYLGRTNMMSSGALHFQYKVQN